MAFERIQDLFNIDLLIDIQAKENFLTPIKSMQIFESSSTVFKKDGLFSIDTFGPMGSAIRNTRLAYIDLHIPILHPLVYSVFKMLKKLYIEILEGKTYVVFDNKVKDFVLSTPDEGFTGYNYFIEHMEKIEFDDHNSEERKFRIKLVKKYGRKDKLLTKWLVIPAGMRDYIMGEDGRPTEDEINSFYRKLLATANMLENIVLDPKDYDFYNAIRLKLQKTTEEIYYYILNLLGDKHGFIQGKWAKRAVSYGTRNVLTPSLNNVTDLNKKNRITANHSVIGLYQYVKGISPITINKVIAKFSSRIFNINLDTAWLVNPKTLRFEEKTIQTKTKEKWLSTDGLEETMGILGLDDAVASPVKVEDNYMFLVYDTGDTITLIRNNEEIVEGMDVKKLRPITYGELFYLAVYDVVDKYPGFVTRYPVISLGSIYPSWTYLKTTIQGREVLYKDGFEEATLYEYPNLHLKWTRSISAHINKLSGLQGDFDGDSLRGHCIVRKIKKCFEKKSSTTYSFENNKKEKNMSIRKRNIIYNYGLINLQDFPRGELIKKEGNVEYYKVPDDIEVLTIWNGDEKWVKPESYSVHKNLTMLAVKTNRGNSLECSDDHSLITLDKDLNYIRTNPVKGMTIPRLVEGVNRYVDPKKYRYVIAHSGIKFNLNEDLGYLFGAIIGDGWVNHNASKELNAIMLAGVDYGIRDKITEVLKNYGYEGKITTVKSPHKFQGFDCYSEKHTWYFKPIAYLLRENIGHKAENKKLPDWWVNTPPGFRWGLLAGLMDTDGTLSLNANNRIIISFCTISQRLAYDFLALVNSLGLTASTNIHKRKDKQTFEYYITLSLGGLARLQKRLKLQHKEKMEKLQSFTRNLDQDIFTYTPNIPEERLRQLGQYIGVKDSLNYGRVHSAINRGKYYNYMPVMNRVAMREIIEKYSEFFTKGDQYWQKLKTIVLDDKIEWEIIDHIGKLPHITEAYDLTVPPYNTFVIQNGIIVYDTVSYNILFTEESVNEIKNLFDNKNYYLNYDNTMVASASNDVVDLVLAHMTE